MKCVVIDTNILVSALWSKDGNPALIVQKVLTQELAICYDYRIMSEYTDVLYRERFAFVPSEIAYILSTIEDNGISVVIDQDGQDESIIANGVVWQDEDDRVFYEVAKYCDAILITGNKHHFPNESFIMTQVEFLAAYQ